MNWYTFVCLAAFGLVIGCGDSPTGVRTLHSVQFLSGGGQSGVVGKPLPNPLRVRAVDGNGSPIPNQVLNFRVVSGGGSVFAGAASTNADGDAQELWTLGTSTSELQRVEVRAVDATTGEPKVFGVFEATPLPDVATALTKVGGDAQQAVVGSGVADSLAVRATDQYGNTVPGVSVTWATGENNGTFSPSTSTTGATGIARSRWTLGPPAGAQSATAAAADLAGSPIQFSATAVPGVAAQLGLATAPSDTGRNNASWSRQPVVQLQDQFGNPVALSGVSVTIGLTGGGGTLNGTATAVTNADGKATFSGLSIAGVEGSRTVTFTSSGLTSTSAAIHLLGGTPASILAEAGNHQSAEEGTPVSVAPTVRVVDVYGNSVGGAAVTFAVASGGGSVTGTTQTTGASGLAQVGSWTLGTGGGVKTLSASTLGVGGTVTGTVTAEAWVPFRANALSAGGSHTCGQSNAYVAYCWGWNVSNPGSSTGGQLGINESNGFRMLPTAVHTGGVTFAKIFAGPVHSCGLTADGTAYCWGMNFQGQVGDGTSGNKRYAPVAVSTAEKFTTLALSASHTCGLDAAGKAFCWGWNLQGQLGIGNTTKSLVPVAVTGGHTFMAITAGGGFVSSDEKSSDGHTCGITTDSTAYCWGAANAGQIGNDREGTRVSNVGFGQLYPDAVAPNGLKFRSIAAGYQHTCAVTSAGAAYCWGGNSRGQLGTGNTMSTRAAVAVTGGLSFESIAVSAAGEYSCGMASAGAVHCWGSNGAGQFGNGTTSLAPVTTPTAAANGLQFLTLTLGGGHACGIRSDLTAYCWGGNTFGQLGDSSRDFRLTPVKVHGAGN